MSSDSRAIRIHALIEERLAPAHLEVQDESAAHIGHAGAREGGHFRVHIVAEEFQGLSSVARHRLVYDAVRELMGRDIHALAIIARTPEEAAL